MVTPAAVVGDVHPLLALGIGGDDRAVNVDHGLVEELGGLLGPDALAGPVDGVYEVQDVTAAEPATEVACGGGVGDSRRTQGVEISLVVAEPLEMLGPGTAGEEIEGDVQDVIGLVVGLMAFEQVQVAIDISDQSGPAC